MYLASYLCMVTETDLCIIAIKNEYYKCTTSNAAFDKKKNEFLNKGRIVSSW